MRILLAEDDRIIADGLGRSLRQTGYAVDWVANGADADNALSSGTYDLLILDLGLPRMSGLDVLRRLRARKSKLPLLILTALDGTSDRVKGLDLGADDYMAKPFEPRELLARLRALLRRAQFSAAQSGASDVTAAITRFGALSIDPNTRSVRINDSACELTAYQFDLLSALAQRAGRVLTREQIMEAVRGRELEAFDRSIDVHIGRIRQAIEADVKNPQRILTVRGVGYVFAKEQP